MPDTLNIGTRQKLSDRRRSKSSQSMEVDLWDHRSLMDWWEGAFGGRQIYTCYENYLDHVFLKETGGTHVRKESSYP